MIKSLWMLVASLLFALMAAFARMGASDFSALELVFYRSAFGAAVIALWVWAQGFTLRTPLVRAHFMRSFLGTFALTIWFYAISKLPLGTAMTLNYTSPLYMALIVIFLAVKNGESFSRASAAAVVLGFFGVTLVLKPELSPG
ncbi:MAG: EamA family transporter, partial [Sutterella wadsworthensis]